MLLKRKLLQDLDLAPGHPRMDESVLEALGEVWHSDTETPDTRAQGRGLVTAEASSSPDTRLVDTYLRENSLVNCSAASVPVLRVEKKRRRNKKKKDKKRNTTRKVGNNICGDK